MMTSDELTLGALKREHTRLSRIATKAKAEVDEYMGAGTEIFTVYAELAKIIESRAHGPQVIKRLGDLKKQQDKAERVKAGESVFVNNCAACHQPDGKGVPDAFPPLAKSGFLNADKIRAVKIVTGGLNGKLTVNGQNFDGVMPAWDLPDEDIANVLTYVYNSWGNSGVDVLPADVKANRVKAD